LRFIKSTGLQTKQQHWHIFTNNQLQHHLLRGQCPYLSKYSIGDRMKRTICVIQTYFERSRFNLCCLSFVSHCSFFLLRRTQRLNIIITFFYYYIRQRRYVILGVCWFVYLFVYLLISLSVSNLRKNY